MNVMEMLGVDAGELLEHADGPLPGSMPAPASDRHEVAAVERFEAVVESHVVAAAARGQRLSEAELAALQSWALQRALPTGTEQAERGAVREQRGMIGALREASTAGTRTVVHGRSWVDALGEHDGRGQDGAGLLEAVAS